jgi:hypothetical protein
MSAEEVAVRLELRRGAAVIRPPTRTREVEGRGGCSEGRMGMGGEKGGGGVEKCPFLDSTTAGQGREEGVGSVAPTAARARRVRAERRCPNRGAPGASDVWTPANNWRERERREAGRMGWPVEKGKWAEPEGTGRFLIFSNSIQTSSNVLIKRWTYQAQKMPNKIWLEMV